MSKYWLFAGSTYYPYGGMEDLKGTYETQDEAESKGRQYDWYEVVVMTSPKPTIVAAPFNKEYDYTCEDDEMPVIDARAAAFDPNEYPPGGMRATET